MGKMQIIIQNFFLYPKYANLITAAGGRRGIKTHTLGFCPPSHLVQAALFSVTESSHSSENTHGQAKLRSLK